MSILLQSTSVFVVSIFLGFLCLAPEIFSNGCNEAVCASIVSKCLLTHSCKCDLKTNTTCSRDCFYCLDYLYTECCTCVEICPKANETDNVLSAKSHVEEFPEGSPDLFNVLTEEKDRLLRWTSYTFPVQVSFITSGGSVPKEIKFDAGTRITTKGDGVDQEEDVQVNCTVAYMSQCMSWNKCKSSCRSMGASAYRWFHDGCCECVGANCVNYGINESKCLQCPFADTGEDSEMAVDQEPPAPSSDGMEEYEAAPAPTEDEDHRQENGVRKDATPPEKQPEKSDVEEKEIANAVPKKPTSLE